MTQQALPVVKGMLDALVLRATSRAAMHGFEITEWIEERSGGELDLEPGKYTIEPFLEVGVPEG